MASPPDFPFNFYIPPSSIGKDNFIVCNLYPPIKNQRKGLDDVTNNRYLASIPKNLCRNNPKLAADEKIRIKLMLNRLELLNGVVRANVIVGDINFSKAWFFPIGKMEQVKLVLSGRSNIDFDHEVDLMAEVQNLKKKMKQEKISLNKETLHNNKMNREEMQLQEDERNDEEYNALLDKRRKLGNDLKKS